MASYAFVASRAKDLVGINLVAALRIHLAVFDPVAGLFIELAIPWAILPAVAS
jgi:hypothetical protein